jgi:shikimate dehydrogenase
MRRFGLIGKTLKHSFSKNYFTQRFKEHQIADCIYESFELQSIEELPSLIAAHPDLEGLNVTIPYKEDVLPFLDRKNDVVEAIEACNCIKISNGKLIGFNTDAIGFKNSLQPQLKPYHKNALVLGTGGASKAVRYALNELAINYQVVSRRKGADCLGYEDIDEEVLKQHKLIINTTPLGMYPNVNDDPPIPYRYITSEHFLFDLIYNPEKTKFLQHGEEQGAQIANGYEMLILQAEESWRIWNEAAD